MHFLAFGFGAGLVPRAPGTAGSVLGLVPAWFMFAAPLSWRIAVVALLALLGVLICGASARRLGVHDHRGIVLDEVVGMFASSLAMPSRSLAWLILAFVLFRFFDVVKPWPIRDVDHRLAGGAGIMLDDLMAALYVAVCLQTLRILLPTT